MNLVTYILVSLVLSAATGETVSPERFVSGPYQHVDQCNAAQLRTEIQKPQDGKVTVYLCRRIDSQSPGQTL